MVLLANKIIDIITYDELFERAKFIVESSKSDTEVSQS